MLVLLMLLINPGLSVSPCSSILLPKYPTGLKSRFRLLCTTPVIKREEPTLQGVPDLQNFPEQSREGIMTRGSPSFGMTGMAEEEANALG